MLRLVEEAIGIRPYGFGAPEDNADLEIVCNLVAGTRLCQPPPRNALPSHVSRKMARKLIGMTGANH